MDDVSQVQKVNALAKELLGHGMASTSDDAFKKAKLMIEGEQKDLPVTNERFDQETRLLDSKIRTLAQEVRSMKETIGKIAEEIDKLRAAETRAPARPVEAPQEVKIEAPQAEAIEEEKEEGSGPDVSIEKIFYCGKK